MTPAQKHYVYKLRLQGLGYKAIAHEMLISVDVIKGYCKRNCLNGPAELVQLNAPVIPKTSGLCLHCKKSVKQKKRGRPKKFCSDACRYTWWNESREQSNRSSEATYHYACQHCGRSFISYGNKQRKYCSHDCYIKARFWRMEELRAQTFEAVY
ncbi:MAG: polymerase subunit sigma-70 [Firmicutes bacterium]|nr:polymerase subunit sigma-70 [Bacillota bacterium]